MNISKIKLVYKDTPGTGKEIYAELGQKFFCVEFTMRDDVPQPITWSNPHSPVYVFSEPWIQFAPKEWNEAIETIYSKLVELWNTNVYKT